MAYEQYTRCIAPGLFVERTLAMLLIRAAVLSPLSAVIALAAGHWYCWLYVAEIYGMALVIAYCRNWLYERLICLGGDVSALGAIVEVNGAKTALFDVDWDNDFTLSLVLQNTPFGVLQAEAQEIAPYGYLIKGQDVIRNPPVNRDTPGLTAVDRNDAAHPGGTGKECAVLHIEFEGSGNYDLLQVAEAGLAFSVAALLACLLPWPVGLVLSVGLAILGLLALLLGAIIGNSNRPGDPADVNPNLGELHSNNDPNDGLGYGADILYVEGTWVYDSLHEGWNEIHPVKVCTKMGCWKGDWNDIFCTGEDMPTPPEVVQRLQHGFQVARAEETRINQARPEHQWRVHPALDACASDIVT